MEGEGVGEEGALDPVEVSADSEDFKGFDSPTPKLFAFTGRRVELSPLAGSEAQELGSLLKAVGEPSPLEVGITCAFDISNPAPVTPTVVIGLLPPSPPKCSHSGVQLFKVSPGLEHLLLIC